jgi:hypothetical protein
VSHMLCRHMFTHWLAGSIFQVVGCKAFQTGYHSCRHVFGSKDHMRKGGEVTFAQVGAKDIWMCVVIACSALCHTRSPGWKVIAAGTLS